jgi:phosphatidylserine decarboxylase
MVIDGIYYALGLLAGAALTAYLTKPAYGLPFLILAVFCLWFFRDPDRQIPTGTVAVSPADGVVVAIKTDDAQTRISIFLNVFDVHVNRAPIAGRITKIEYRTGKFLVASRPEATLDNEQNFITIEGPAGKVVFSQIAGLIARRIICYKKVGDTVQAGERIGYIKFGSRVDMFLAREWSIQVKVGQRVAGGSDIIARRT